MQQKIQIIRSRKRKKTVSAQLRDGVLEIRAPHNIRERELQKVIAKLQQKINKKYSNSDDETLLDVAQKLNKKYFDGKLIINSIEYSSRQKSFVFKLNLRGESGS
jgi:predicted metal-dependent hydrolase